MFTLKFQNSRKRNNFNLPFRIFTAIVITFIVFIFALIFGTIIYNASSSNVSFGPAGLVEIRCVDGYKFTISEFQTRQMISENGTAIKCE